MTDLRSDNEVQETAPPPKKTKSSIAKAPVEKTGPPAAKAKGKGKAKEEEEEPAPVDASGSFGNNSVMMVQEKKGPLRLHVPLVRL